MKKYLILLALYLGLTMLFVGCTNSVDEDIRGEQVASEENGSKVVEIGVGIEEEKLKVDIESSGDILSNFVNMPGLVKR